MATLNQRVNALVRSMSPGATAPIIMVINPRDDARAMEIEVPHYLGRVPDKIEIIDMQDLRIILEALGVVFPTPAAGGVNLLHGPALTVTALDLGVFRPEGAPHVHVKKKGLSSQYILLHSFFFNTDDREDDLTIAVVPSLQQGVVDPVANDPCALVANRLTEIVAVPDNGAAPLSVTFYPSDLNLLTDKGLQGLTWTWDFGDGSPTEETSIPIATHTYLVADTYTVTLTGRLDCAGPIEIVAVDIVTAT